MDSAIICNTTQENIHKYRSKKKERKKKNKMCCKNKCPRQCTVDLINNNNNISRDVQEECKQVVQCINI